ncbi:MAG: fatty acid desaturase [Kofleriaceae bacterium]|nr:fatty acid desaturase [Kofleriaceae bacterium]
MDRTYLAKALLLPRSTYVGVMRPELPVDVFRPATSRLAWIPLHLAVIVGAAVAIASRAVPWFVVPFCSLAIGASFAGLTFIAHEMLHGGIVRARPLRYVAGWISFVPFTLSPRLWLAWHDRVHHANTNTVNDPDVYPTLAEYRSSRAIQLVTDAFSLGGRRWRGGLSLVLGFTVQSAHQLVTARRRGFLSSRGWRIAIAETAAGVLLWAVVATLVGFVPFVFVYVAPLVVANVIVMAFILTNHNLSPRVEIDDPLVSGLSVTAPRWLEWLTLQFGYHVEHHLFPAMSSRHARKVRELLRKHWPGRYQSMPLWRALQELHRTGRVYKDAITLLDPRSGREYATLMPRRGFEPCR